MRNPFPRSIIGIAFALAAGCGGEKLGARDLSGVADLSAQPDLARSRCAEDTHCGGATPRCDVTAGECVPCLPVNDNCPQGMACTDATGRWACSDTCHVAGDCAKLGMAGACCANVCVDPATSPKNCGACGNACPGATNAMGGCEKAACVLACDPGFGDCDHLPGNGCETTTDSDAKNCGVCGKVCPAASNARASCDSGACSAACNSGYRDCNKNPQDGCEIDATGDPSNCGDCGTVCKAPSHAVPFCNQNVCTFQCQLGFLDCDGNSGNGCEVNAGVDAKNCGHCGNACPVLPNAAGGCMGGQCGAGQCDNNFGDCDRNPMNGCESKTDVDLANCGGCGKGCKAVNGGAACANGVCTITCNQSFFDCNGDGKDGCEANIKSDAKNCGGCGNVCPMNLPGCNNGVCSAGCVNGRVPPDACVNGNDAHTGSLYTVCAADCADAWIAAVGGGTYHATEICNSFGYTRLGSYGGTCGVVCGYCDGASCNAKGNKFFDGGGNAGVDQFGQMLSFTVHWQCLP